MITAFLDISTALTSVRFDRDEQCIRLHFADATQLFLAANEPFTVSLTRMTSVHPIARYKRPVSAQGHPFVVFQTNGATFCFPVPESTIAQTISLLDSFAKEYATVPNFIVVEPQIPPHGGHLN